MQEAGKTKPYLTQSLIAIGVAFELGFIIALPVTILALLASHYGNVWHMHYLVYLSFPVSLTLSSFWVYIRLSALVKRLQDAAKRITNNSIKKD